MAASWLIARPIAHRGLHDAAAGVIENTTSAFEAAAAANYPIECDVQLTSDGEAIVHHDDVLGRLTDGKGRLVERTAASLRTVPFHATADRMLSLGELCDLVSGRVPIFVEIKSRFDGDLRLANRTASVLKGYKGPAAAMSFDPEPIAALRTFAPDCPRGIVAQARYSPSEWKGLTAATRHALAYFTHAVRSRPQFLAYAVKDLPAAIPSAARELMQLPLLTWTVQTPAERETAAQHADQMIFEGFRP